MQQKHYHIYILTLSLLLTASGCLLTITILQDYKWPWIVIALSLTTYLCILTWRAASYVPEQIQFFLSSILNADTTSRFPLTQDKEMQQMYSNMNTIMKEYTSTHLDLETRKLYYDRILRIMTHELRNSITPMITLSEDMLKNEYDPEDRQEAISVINEQSCHIKHFLDSYHELTHLPQPQMKPTDVRSLFIRLERLFSTGTTPSLVLSFYCAQGLTITCDENQIMEVMTNLIKNAIEALPHDVNGFPQGTVKVVATDTDNTGRITVTDNGQGIPASKIEDIFLPFYTSKPTGSGIGLAISRQIMQLHGGNLTCYSNVGEGTTFVMDF